MDNRIVFAAPSILSADFGNRTGTVRHVNESESEWIHVDLIDGHIAGNLSSGPRQSLISNFEISLSDRG
ncbi:MAG: hypothetical protein LBK62_09420 [Treponema sp.]|jgi:ribulose-phosphate 3-epimerase|nr:hypothetical protein [Treponema sp.]